MIALSYTCHTDFVGQGTTFFLIPGERQATPYVPLAIKKGATTIVYDSSSPLFDFICRCSHKKLQTEKCLDCTVSYKKVTCARTELEQKVIQPTRQPKRVWGVTGTKGKSTTCFFLYQLLESLGHKTALISGVDCFVRKDPFPSYLTTPPLEYVWYLTEKAFEQECSDLVIEVSSHALCAGRIKGLKLFCALFTSLSEDHLDYHGNFSSYVRAKIGITDYLQKGGKLYVGRDIQNEELFSAHLQKALEKESFFPVYLSYERGEVKSSNLEGTRIEWRERTYFLPKIYGKFNGYNLLLALCAVSSAYKDIEKKELSFLALPKGRCFFHRTKRGVLVVVDFAHTYDSCLNLLSFLEKQTTHLTVVFGCGGEKYKGRRKGMAQAISLYAHQLFITQDNSRGEIFEDIAKEIISHIPPSKKYSVTLLSCRKEAIKQAILTAPKGGIVAVIGRGHETNLHIAGQLILLDDGEYVRHF